MVYNTGTTGKGVSDMTEYTKRRTCSLCQHYEDKKECCSKGIKLSGKPHRDYCSLWEFHEDLLHSWSAEVHEGNKIKIHNLLHIGFLCTLEEGDDPHTTRLFIEDLTKGIPKGQELSREEFICQYGEYEIQRLRSYCSWLEKDLEEAIKNSLNSYSLQRDLETAIQERDFCIAEYKRLTGKKWNT